LGDFGQDWLWVWLANGLPSKTAGAPLRNVQQGHAALGCLSGKMAGKRRGGRGSPCAAGANSSAASKISCETVTKTPKYRRLHVVMRVPATTLSIYVLAERRLDEWRSGRGSRQSPGRCDMLPVSVRPGRARLIRGGR
jgi:hypothetical protein